MKENTIYERLGDIVFIIIFILFFPISIILKIFFETYKKVNGEKMAIDEITMFKIIGWVVFIQLIIGITTYDIFRIRKNYKQLHIKVRILESQLSTLTSRIETLSEVNKLEDRYR